MYLESWQHTIEALDKISENFKTIQNEDEEKIILDDETILQEYANNRPSKINDGRLFFLLDVC